MAEALAAVAAAYPEADRIRCYEYPVDSEFPVEVARPCDPGGNGCPAPRPPSPLLLREPGLRTYPPTITPMKFIIPDHTTAGIDFSEFVYITVAIALRHHEIRLLPQTLEP